MPNPIIAESLFSNRRDELKQRLIIDKIQHDLMADLLPHQRAVFGVLAIAEHCRLDPVPLLYQLSDEMPGSDRYWTQLLAESTRQGVAPSEAISQSSGFLTPLSQFAWRSACELNVVPQLNRELLNRSPESADVRTAAGSGTSFSKYWRLFFRAVFFVVILSFILLKIVPEFKTMLEEFEIEMSSAMTLLLRISDFVMDWSLLIPVIFLILLLTSFPMWKEYLQRWSPIRWHQRLLHPTVARRRALALALQTRPIDLGNTTAPLFSDRLAELFPRFSAVNARMEKGQTAWAALRSENLISQRDLTTLEQTRSPETQAWLLRWSAANQQDDRETKTALLQRAVSTAIHVALGLLALLICLAIFTTLIDVIKGML